MISSQAHRLSCVYSVWTIIFVFIVLLWSRIIDPCQYHSVLFLILFLTNLHFFSGLSILRSCMSIHQVFQLPLVDISLSQSIRNVRNDEKIKIKRNETVNRTIVISESTFLQAKLQRYFYSCSHCADFLSTYFFIKLKHLFSSFFSFSSSFNLISFKFFH